MSSQKPLVSVIIPFHNAEKWIRETLESLLKQSYRNIELLLINDMSVDNSMDVVNSFHDERLRVYTQPRKGAAAARNYGLRESKGAYIKFWDADDLMNPKHIEKQYESIKNHPGYISSCKWARFRKHLDEAVFRPESVWQDMNSPNWVRKALEQREDMAASWLWLIPREIMENSGGWDERLTLNDDFEFSMRLLTHSKGVRFAGGAMTYYRSAGSDSLSLRKTGRDFKNAILSTDLGCAHVLSLDNSPEMKTLCADRYQEWLFRIYPEEPELIKEIELKIKQLGGSNRRIQGGLVLRMLATVSGWKKAKRLQLIAYKAGYKP